jgi:HEAT repeat protein
LRDRLEEGLPPRARAAALEALGAQGERAPLKYLLSTVDEEGFNGFAQAGAFAALARTRTKKALKVLMKKALPGRSPSRARFAAVSQLGSIVPWIPDADQKQLAVELLIDLLRDNDRKVRAHAVQGLRAAGDPQAIRHLERYRALLPKQDQVAIDASIADIRSAAPPTQPTRDIEALGDKLRRLEQAVQELEAKKGKKG